MSCVIEDVLVRDDPAGPALPLVLDSPHSGTVYPADFGFVCPFSQLRQAEDTHVDALFAGAPEHGATLLQALFPRSYIDVNRAIDDIDPDLLKGRWPGELNPSEKSRMGIGLVRRLCKPGMPMYDGRLSPGQIAERIDRYYRPYHAQLAAVIDGLADRFGMVWHINCHSMPSVRHTSQAEPSAPEADFVVGTLDGRSCGRDLTWLVTDTLRVMNYRVLVNDPYKGVEIVRRHGAPTRGRHSLQLEINRRLYMDEETLARSPNFDCLASDLDRLVEVLAQHLRDRFRSNAAAE